jgi:uncharacterized protein involved in high-affinity Fe2+ transport
MNKLLRSTLIAAVFVLPTAVFAQSNTPVEEMQVETIAYEAAAPDSMPVQMHPRSLSDHAARSAGTLSDSQFSPAADIGLNSIYIHH